MDRPPNPVDRPPNPVDTRNQGFVRSMGLVFGTTGDSQLAIVDGLGKLRKSRSFEHRAKTMLDRQKLHVQLETEVYEMRHPIRHPTASTREEFPAPSGVDPEV